MRVTLLILCCLLMSIPARVVGLTLPSESEQTQFYAMVCDQATISVPDEVLFDVVDVTVDTRAEGFTVGATNLVLEVGGVLRIELKADAPEFLAPEGGATTWSASDVSWEAGTWTGGTGYAGTLENGVYHTVAETLGNPSELSNTNMAFTLQAKPTITYAGVYSLTGTWRFSSFTP